MGTPDVGFNRQGVADWKTRLNSVHEAVIQALNDYRRVAQQNNEVAFGAHFQSINSQCEDITNKHLADHTDLHTQYITTSDKLVRGIDDIAG